MEVPAELFKSMAGLNVVHISYKSGSQAFTSLVGGETARSPGPLFLNIALTGTVARTRCVLRSDGKPGDALYITGRLGGSLAGKHLDFTPRLAESRWLTENFRLHAMMEARPDWVLSRQRAWGVPLACFMKDHGNGEIELLRNEAVNARIEAAFLAHAGFAETLQALQRTASR